MSFILDALKKSESDRQRQSGPALFEVKVAPPRTRLPTWALAIAALLVINLGIVMWMLLRHPVRGATEGEVAAGTSSAEAAAAAGAPALARTTTPAGPTLPAPAAAPPAALGAPAPVAAAAPPGAASPPTLAPAVTAGSQASAAQAALARPNPLPVAGGGGGTEQPNPDDYAPAEEPAVPAPGLANHVRRGTAAGVPLYQDAAATPGTQIPQLRLDLHVFAARPQDRFVMINMHKLREGDTLPEGVRVESITQEGAVLSYNGSRFLLTRE